MFLCWGISWNLNWDMQVARNTITEIGYEHLNHLWHNKIPCLPQPALQPVSIIPAENKQAKHNQISNYLSGVRWHRKLIFRKYCHLDLVQYNLGNLLLYQETLSVKVNYIKKENPVNLKKSKKIESLKAEIEDLKSDIIRTKKNLYM